MPYTKESIFFTNIIRLKYDEFTEKLNLKFSISIKLLIFFQKKNSY